MSSIPIDILSWNVCWGCMSSNSSSKYDITAKELAQHCETLNTGNNVCLNNVVKIINNKFYDFIGLQEIVGWNEMITKSPRLQNMGFVHSTVTTVPEKKIEFITFFNHNRFNLLFAKQGNIDPDNLEGRPYHILFLTDKSDGKQYIIVNLHNGKGRKYITIYIFSLLGAHLFYLTIEYQHL